MKNLQVINVVIIRRRVIEVILQQKVNQCNIIRPSVLSGEEYTKQNCLKFWNFLNLPQKNEIIYIIVH